MLTAELKGKLPAGVRNLEDVLTSYVFNFLQYSTRTVYLAEFLRALGIDASKQSLGAASFRFWPTLDDGTEPDLVLRVGDHYLLFEAKLFASFDPGDSERQPQVEREIREGMVEAEREGRQFQFVAVTADSCFRPAVLRCQTRYARLAQWTNWQSIARLILAVSENLGERAPDREYALDLLAILDARNLRGFRGFDELVGEAIPPPQERIFLRAEQLAYRGEFIGFAEALHAVPVIGPPPSGLFASRKRFSEFPTVPRPPNPVFFEGK